MLILIRFIKDTGAIYHKDAVCGVIMSISIHMVSIDGVIIILNIAFVTLVPIVMYALKANNLRVLVLYVTIALKVNTKAAILHRLFIVRIV